MTNLEIVSSTSREERSGPELEHYTYELAFFNSFNLGVGDNWGLEDSKSAFDSTICASGMERFADLEKAHTLALERISAHN